jgi:hypothetical protein
MANNNNGSSGMLGEISTIRNILMGDQMSQYETRFAEMQTAMEAAQSSMEKELRMTAGGTEERLGKLETDINARFDKLEKMLTDNIAQMNKRLDEVSSADKQQLGQMLAAMGEKLMGK